MMIMIVKESELEREREREREGKRIIIVMRHARARRTLHDALVRADSKKEEKKCEKRRIKRVLHMGAVERREPSFCAKENNKNIGGDRRECSISSARYPSASRRVSG